MRGSIERKHRVDPLSNQSPTNGEVEEEEEDELDHEEEEEGEDVDGEDGAWEEEEGSEGDQEKQYVMEEDLETQLMISPETMRTMLVKDLRRALSKRGLTTSGRKVIIAYMCSRISRLIFPQLKKISHDVHARKQCICVWCNYRPICYEGSRTISVALWTR